VQRGRLVAALVIVVFAAACGSGGDTADQAGPCKIEPGVVCRNENLQGVSMVAANLKGADFSGSDLTRADLRDADLTGAKFVKSGLSAVNFTGANLTNANLTGANLFSTNFSNAILTGANRTGTFVCNVTQPDGGLVTGQCPSGGSSLVPNPTPSSGPPSIQYFRPASPPRCLNDASGPGIEVEWASTNVTALSFSVDGIRIDGGAVQPTGTQRLPFNCDGQPHVVMVQAFGAATQSTSSSFTVSLRDTAPLAPPGA
jgi:hypothetical protein